MTGHILIAHDLRDTADLALRRAAQLARQHDAKLTLLHVFDPRLDQAPEVERAAVNRRVQSLVDRHRLAGQGRLIRGGLAAGDDSIGHRQQQAFGSRFGD